MIGILLACGLAAVFTYSVAAHTSEPRRIATAVADLGAPGWLGWAAAGAEAGLIVMLIAAPRVGGIGTATYLVILIAVFGWAVMSGRDIEDCGCGRNKHSINAFWFVRNSTLLGISLGVFALAPGGIKQISLPAAGLAAITVSLILALRAANQEKEQPPSGESVDMHLS